MKVTDPKWLDIWCRGWKVVSRCRQSAVIDDPRARVTYTRHEIVLPRPHCGPLCVFYEQWAAVEWANRKGGLEVLAVGYVPTVAKLVWSHGGGRARLSEMPPYTALARAVYPLE